MQPLTVNFMDKSSQALKPLSGDEIYAEVVKSLEQADAGLCEDADAALDEISAELGILQ